MTFGDVALALVAFSIGTKLPDVDLAPLPVWRHRSAWTHGPLLPVALYFVSGLGTWQWWLVVGLLPALFGHHLLDCFPKQWRGSSLIKTYPLPWAFNALLSFIWIATGALTSGVVWWALTGRFIMEWVK